MLLPEIVQWIKDDIKPVELTTPEGTVGQMVQTAIRYWNTHSAFRIIRMYNATVSTKRVQLDTDFKNVVRVYPASQADWILQNYPLWSLLGITIIDNVTSDLVMLSEAFKNYRYYIGTDFHFHFERSNDPSVGGYLYLDNVPTGTNKICVVGCKRITEVEDITDEFILDWILQYAKSLTLAQEGNTLRKSGVIGIQNDGQQMIDEAKTKIEELKKELNENGRWVSFVQRF